MERVCEGRKGSLVTFWALGFIWIILFFGVHGCAYVGFQIVPTDLSIANWFLLIVSLVFFAWVEGYRGFHKSWAPFVVRRGFLLPHCLQRDCKSVWTILLAPFFVAGLFYASPKRLAISYTLYPLILFFIYLVVKLESPYHEIVDLSVALGLSIGTISYTYFIVKTVRTQHLPADVDSADYTPADDVDEPLIFN